MVNLYLVNPAHKLRFVSRLILRGAKRILGNVAAPSKIPDDVELEKRPPKINLLDLIKKDLPPIPRGGLTRSADYYRDESEGGFVVFRVEDTLFKVCFVQYPFNQERNTAYDYLQFVIRCTSATCCESRRLLETCLVFRLSKETKRVCPMTPPSPCRILRSSSKICSGFYTPCTSFV